jgi:hypothetical protein
MSQQSHAADAASLFSRMFLPLAELFKNQIKLSHQNEYNWA